MRSCAALLVLFLVLAGCGDPPKSSSGPNASPPSTSTTFAAKGPRALGRAPFFTLTDQDGKSFQSKDLLGRVWVATFFFTRCRQTCPIQTARLVEFQESLQEHKARDQIHVVSISVDAANDTPQLMKAYAEAYDADLAHWTFLTGVEKDIWYLSEEGFKLPAGPDPDNAEMPIGHSARFVVIDRRGLIRAYVDSQPEGSAEALLAAVEPLLEEPAATDVLPPEAGREQAWFDARRRAQEEAAAGSEVDHDFQFQDRRMASRIRFLHRSTDDSGKYYKPVHYDHGNSVSVADVDGDGFLDVYFCNQVGSNELWRNRGDGTFENITKEAGVGMKEVISVAASFADTDNDGDPDLYVTSVREGNRFFVNEGGGRFRDVTLDAGLAHKGHSSASVFFDYDRDGLVDLFVCNVGVYTTEAQGPVIDDSTTVGCEAGPFSYYVGVLDGFSGHLKRERDEPSILYRNLGGNRFKDVTADTLIRDVSWSGAASPIDFDGDGDLDLYLLDMQGDDEAYENQDGKAFVRVSRKLFPRTSWGAMGIKVFDWDQDGDFDIYITDMHSDMSEEVGPEREKLKSNMRWPKSLVGDGQSSIWGNTFFRNDGKGGFEEVSDQIGAENYWPWGLSVGDLNADGYEDVFIASGMNYPFRYGANSVLLNDRGRTFVDSEFVLGVEPRKGVRSKPWFDLQCPEDDPKGKGHCADVRGPAVVWAPLGSRSSAIFDLDGDGDLDIVTNEFNAQPQVLISDLAQRHPVHFLKVRLMGTTSNRDGLGAVVRVHAGGRVWTQAMDGQSGYLAQSVAPLYFGLGTATQVEKVEVQWLGGPTQVVSGEIPVNDVLVVRQDG